MERLPDTIYIVDPYDEDGNLVTNTEDVCWCEDPAGDENVAYVSRATVAAALRELRAEYEDCPLLGQEFAVELLDATITKLGLSEQRERQEEMEETK